MASGQFKAVRRSNPIQKWNARVLVSAKGYRYVRTTIVFLAFHCHRIFVDDDIVNSVSGIRATFV
jgi:hypothetical protein